MAVATHFPKLKSGDNPTGCCSRFVPNGWEDQVFDLSNMLFIRTTSRSLFYIPLNMSAMMTQAWEAITNAPADHKDEFVMLSHDLSPWQCEHYLLVAKNVPGQEMAKIKGKFRTKVFEGPYQDAPKWIKAMNSNGKVYLYYTTCPKCSKYYGKNYVVAFAPL